MQRAILSAGRAAPFAVAGAGGAHHHLQQPQVRVAGLQAVPERQAAQTRLNSLTPAPPPLLAPRTDLGGAPQLAAGHRGGGRDAAAPAGGRAPLRKTLTGRSRP